MEKLKWLFELIDNMSGPAKKISKSLDSVSSSLDKTGRDAFGRFTKQGSGASGLFSKVLGPKLTAAFGSIGESIKSAFAPARRDEMGRFLKQGKGLQALEGIGSGLASFGGALAGVGATAAVAAGGLAIVGGKWALGALSFKENTLAAFKAMLGSSKEAQTTFAAAQKFAAETPFTTDQVVGSFQKLITGGFRGDQLTTLMKAAGDVGSLMGTDKMDSVITALSQIQAKGKLSGEEMMQLAEAGISQKVVYETLAKTLGKTTDQVRALGEAGKISSAQGIAAITETIRTTLSGGELGGAMAAQSKTLSGLFSTLQSVPFDLLMAIDETTALAPLKDFVVSLTAALSPDSEAGQRIIAIFNQIGSAFGEAFHALNGGRDISVVLRGILNVVEPMVTAFLAFGKGAGQGLGAVFTPLLDVAVMLGKQPGFVEDLTKTFTMLGQVAGFVLGAIVVGFGAILAAQVWVLDKVRQLVEWFTQLGAELQSNWRNIGISIIEGLIDGITSMLNPLGAISGAVAETLTGKLLGTTGASVTPGSMLSGMGTSPMANAAVAAGAPGAGGPAQVSIQIGDVPVTVPESADAAGAARNVAGGIKDALAAELSKLGLGFGG